VSQKNSKSQNLGYTPAAYNNKSETKKMKKISILGMATLSFLWAGMAFSEDEEESTMYTYATYLYCDTSKEDQADADAERSVPVMNKLVEDGAIAGWGWLAHMTGGQWRRIRYHNATSLEGAFDGLSAINEALTAEFGEDDDGDGGACPAHDDYIWQAENGGGGDDGRGSAGFSVYFNCDIINEGRADEIVEESMAGVLNKIVEDGGLTSWGWSSHVIGGEYRRLQTMTAPDFSTLLTGRAAALEAFYNDENPAGEEFAKICGDHSDYMWNVVHESQ
jgi:hypothetical protein